MKKQISMILALLFCIPLFFIGCSSEPINILPTDSGKISVNGWGAFLIDADHKLWAWGCNSSNQLGLGWDIYKTSEPMLVMEDVVKVSSYNLVPYSLALKSDGTVWQWGPPQTSSNPSVNPAEYQGSDDVLTKKVFEDAKDIAVTAEGAMAVKTNGEVWAWGSDIFGFIPDSTGLCKNKEPYLIMKNGKYVYTRYQSFGVLTEGGELYCWGMLFGDAQYTPKKVAGGVKQVDFGYTTYFMKQDNSLWGFGGNAYGQLGNGADCGGDGTSKKAIVSSPVKIAENVKDFAHVGESLIYVLDDGTLWGCGSNNSGQLGNGVEGFDQARLENQPIQIDTGVSNVYSSDIYVSFYTKENTLWSCGTNYHGLLGIGAEYDSTAEWGSWMKSTPQKVLEGNILDFVVSNSNHIVCIMSSGEILTWGVDPLFFFTQLEASEIPPQIYLDLLGDSDFSSQTAITGSLERCYFNTPQKITLPEGFTARTE